MSCDLGYGRYVKLFTNWHLLKNIVGMDIYEESLIKALIPSGAPGE